MRSDRSASALCCVLLLLAMILAAPLKTSAATTTLTLQLPESYTIDLNIRGQGNVWLNGVQYTRTASVTMPRLSALRLLVIPNDNGSLQSVALNGEKQALSNGQYVLELSALTGDITLDVRFRTNSIIPNTGDWILIPVGAMILSGIFLILIRRSKKKASRS